MRLTPLAARIAIFCPVAGLCAAVPLAGPPGIPARAPTATPIYLDPS